MAILEEVEPDARGQRLAVLIDIGFGILLGARSSNAAIPTTGSKFKDDLLYDAGMSALYAESIAGIADRWHFLPDYAFETRLVQRRGENVVLSRCGRTLLETPGLDALRWLLALEAAQSLGREDDMRLSPELAALLSNNPERHETVDDDAEPHEEWQISWATVRRLGALGLLKYHDDPDLESPYIRGYEVIERHRSLLDDIAQRRSTPFAVLADALLRDEVAGIVERIHPDAARVSQENAAAASALQARMVAHEIRNALIPVQVTFSSLISDLVSGDSTGPRHRQRARIEAGIQRALDFVDGMLRVANLGLEGPSTFDVDSALRDACAALSRELNGNFRQAFNTSGATLMGPRARFILAVANLLRNAAQAITGVVDGRVSIATEVGADHISIHVDDNGSGVPQEQRSVVFEPGFTSRSGGSGQGLALVRQVVEGEMRGTVTCTESPLGGARFSLRFSRST
ncbi:sensor histidine kinase [Polyangium jinanense]|uniref:histidine kinase n=1 Tax=Polyangium jinanense TaxID=2829994 RepID=A0A9X4AZY1_9BACT|nr:HAMP domain-containing sensor histidine kinase [Polyangium jinanense]MDC3961209.1 HAMP domain-containing histidine kinase [Polyangium jinanense]MDC3988597.1 HAMP domain-containing histidine kinase [Polyangium jinanense]